MFEDAAVYFMNPQGHVFKNVPHNRFLLNCFLLCHPRGPEGKYRLTGSAHEPCVGPQV